MSEKIHEMCNSDVLSPQETLRIAVKHQNKREKYVFLRMLNITYSKFCKSWPFENVHTLGIFKESLGCTRLFSLQNEGYVKVHFHTEALPSDGCIAEVYGMFPTYNDDTEDTDELLFNVLIWKELQSLHKALEMEELLYTITTRLVPPSIVSTT